MAKKKKTAPPEKQDFNRSPFSDLKGFAVSAEPAEEKKQPPVSPAVKADSSRSFAEEMALLGVERLNKATDGREEVAVEYPPEEIQHSVEQSEEEQFLQAMGELQVSFSDSLPVEETAPVASARRMKQLRQGKLKLEATLDLHGLKQFEVAEKMQFFLQNAHHQGLQTLLVITGRGLHSVDGQPVLRQQAERFLTTEGRNWVNEWGRAPKQLGGDGALILFLRKKVG